MTTYVFRVWLRPNPALAFEPDGEVWRDVELDGSHTLEEFHETIFDAFDRWDTHGYEFRTHDEDGIVTRNYVDPRLYEDKPSWPPMDADQIERFIDQMAPDDVSEEAKERFRNLRSDPPREADASDTTIEALDPEGVGLLSYVFDFGDGWEHTIELREQRSGSLDGDPVVVDERGDAPPQYPGLDE